MDVKQLHSRESEEALLGSVLINPEVYPECAAVIDAKDFYIDRHKWIWGAITNLIGRGLDIDILTVSTELARHKQDVDTSYLTALIGQSPNSYNAASYAQEVKDKARRRMQVRIAEKIAEGAYNGGVDVSEMVAKLVQTTDLKGKSERLSPALSRYYDHLEERARNPVDVWGIPTYYTDLDKTTGGLHKKHVLMLSGAPGTGKSVLAASIILQSALHGTRWAVYSLEMATEDLINRWVCQMVGLTESTMSSGRIPDGKWPAITQAIETLDNLPIHINDTPRLTTTDIMADLSQIVATDGADAVCVDYLELLGDRGDNPNEATAQKSRGFRNVCRELNVAGLIIQSMTKEGIGAATGGIVQGDKRKGFASAQSAMIGVRGPADVSHDADTIFMLVNDPEFPAGNVVAALPAKMRHGNGNRRPIRFVWNAVSPKLEPGMAKEVNLK